MQLVAIVQRSKHPVVIALGSDSKPIDSKERAEGLATLISEIPNAHFDKADHLVGCEAAPRGDGMVALGLIASRRRVTPPGKRGFSRTPGEQRPSLFIDELHRIVNADMPDKWFVNAPAIRCDECCEDRALDTFEDNAVDRAAANLHNLSGMLRAIARIDDAEDRLDELTALYQDAATAHANLSSRVEQPVNPPTEQLALHSRALRDVAARVGTPPRGTANQSV